MAITSKMFEKQLWKSDILSKDAVKMQVNDLHFYLKSLFHSCFSNILLVKANYLVCP